MEKHIYQQAALKVWLESETFFNLRCNILTAATPQQLNEYKLKQDSVSASVCSEILNILAISVSY